MISLEEKDIRSNNDFYKREIIRIHNSDVFKNFLKDENFYQCTDIELKYLIKMDHYSDEKRVIKNISSLYISVQQNKKLIDFLDKYLVELLNRKIINEEIKQKWRKFMNDLDMRVNIAKFVANCKAIC